MARQRKSSERAADKVEARPGKPRNVRVKRDPAATRRAGAVGRAVRGVASGMRSAARRFRGPLGVALRVLIGCAAIAAAVTLGRVLQHHLTSSPAFAIDTIEIAGLSRIDRGELLVAAGIDRGVNVFLRSPEEVKQRLLTHPWIAEAKVQRRLPGRFDVTIREREPVALLVVEPCSDRAALADGDDTCDEGSSLYLVADDGKVFKRLDARDPVDLPVITGVERQRFGTDPEFHERVLLEVVALLQDYRAEGMWKSLPIGEIHVEPSDAFSLYVGDALTLVRLGLPPFRDKLGRMKKVFARLTREQATAEYVYLDNEERPDRVTVRLR